MLLNLSLIYLLNMIIWIRISVYCKTISEKEFPSLIHSNLEYETFLTNPLITGLDKKNADLEPRNAATTNVGIGYKIKEGGVGLATVEDYEKAAAEILPKIHMVYFNGGAGQGITLVDNILAFRRLLIKPRVLVDVSKRELSKNFFGGKVDFPLGVSPTAMQKKASPEGEIATAKAAAAAGTIYIMSTMSSIKIEDVVKAVPHGRKWMQVYILKQRSNTVNIIRRAEKNGFEALVVTVDQPVLRIRPDMHKLKLQEEGQIIKNWTLGNFGAEMIDVHDRTLTVGEVVRDMLFDASITWDDLRWLKSITKLPVIVKGILNPDDAEKVIEYGLDGVFVSNHGGRQIDNVQATIDALPEIVNRLRGRCPVMVDGGVRTGSDIFKALALGADMVFAGRPFLWGNAVNGELGVSNIFKILKNEFNTTMALSGVRNIEEITEDYIGRRQCPVTFR